MLDLQQEQNIDLNSLTFDASNTPWHCKIFVDLVYPRVFATGFESLPLLFAGERNGWARALANSGMRYALKIFITGLH